MVLLQLLTPRIRPIVVLAAALGGGLAWLVQPAFPPYAAHVRMILTAPAGTGDWDRRVDDWCKSLIAVNRTDHTGPVSASFTHPRQQKDDFDIVISSRERGFALEVVRDLVDEAVRTPGIYVDVVSPPAPIRFSEPSPILLAAGAAIGLLLGSTMVRRGIAQKIAPLPRSPW